MGSFLLTIQNASRSRNRKVGIEQSKVPDNIVKSAPGYWRIALKNYTLLRHFTSVRERF